ncbi:MAG: hypothetical protein ACLQNV_21055 [Steroidobacteraceae bacterium]
MLDHMHQKARREWQNCSGIKKLMGSTKPVAARIYHTASQKKLARQKFTINVAFLPQFSRPRAVLY